MGLKMIFETRRSWWDPSFLEIFFHIYTSGYIKSGGRHFRDNQWRFMKYNSKKISNSKNFFWGIVKNLARWSIILVHLKRFQEKSNFEQGYRFNYEVNSIESPLFIMNKQNKWMMDKEAQYSEINDHQDDKIENQIESF